MEVLYALNLLGVLAFFVVRPLLRPRATGGGAESSLDELETLKEARFRKPTRGAAERSGQTPRADGIPAAVRVAGT